MRISMLHRPLYVIYAAVELSKLTPLFLESNHYGYMGS